MQVNDVIGKALDYIGPYTKLNNKEHVVAYVDKSLCINCGKTFTRNFRLYIRFVYFLNNLYLNKIIIDPKKMI